MTAEASILLPGAIYSGPQSALRRWRAARSKVLAGTGRAQVACFGDSKTLGYGSSANFYTGAKTKAFPRKLAALLTAMGLPANDRSIFGTGHVGSLANTLLADPRLALGAGWAEFGSYSLGGFFFSNPTDTSSLAFTPTPALDTIEVWDVTNSGCSSYSVNVDGGAALQTVAKGSGGLTLRKTTITGASLGAHTVNVQVSGTPSAFYCLGVDTYDSTTPDVRVHNLGSYALQASQANTSANAWSPIPMITLMAADLYIMQLGTNEWINGVSPATFIANMGPLIAAAQAVGDVILVAPSFSSTAVSTQVAQDAIIAACYTLAATYSVPLIDFSRWIGDYTTANTLGQYYDITHESGAGYANEAAILARALMA